MVCPLMVADLTVNEPGSNTRLFSPTVVVPLKLTLHRTANENVQDEDSAPVLFGKLSSQGVPSLTGCAHL
jgi:hypothetical protein